jgi:phage recombination protein Bet
MSEPNGTAVATQAAGKRSLIAVLAAQYDMEPGPFMDAIVQTVMPTDKQITNAMVAAFLMVCNEHGLNPFTREIFAFPSKTGGIQPIVSIDGWVKLINQHPQFAGMDLAMDVDEKTGKPISCTCTIYRKDRPEHATPITEYYDECYRNTDPWNKMPKRMMRHKAVKEAGRYTFGFAGIMDEDEARDAINITAISQEMERSTATATEKLKEKIGAKKAAAKKEEATENRNMGGEGYSSASILGAATPPVGTTDPPPAPEQAPPPTSEDDLGDLLDKAEAAEATTARDPESTLTDAERQSILDILKTKGKDEATTQKVMLEARKFFLSLGAKASKDLKFKSLQPCIEWATALKV